MSDCGMSSARPRKHRARSTNRLHKIAGLHEQSQPGRRYGDLTRAWAATLGGEDALDENVRMAIRRAAELTVAAEMHRAAMLRGDPVDPLALVRLENAANRALKALRLDQARKPKARSLKEYLAARAAKRGDLSG